MDSEQTVQSGLEFLTGLNKFGMVLTLDRIKALLLALGQPHEQFPVVHVAGTNGKGSTSRLVAGALQAAGLKTGLFTSPHLIQYNERIMVNGRPVGDGALLDLIAHVKPLIPDVAEKYGHPTEFEVSTAMAFLHFACEKVDIAVIEVGLGGTWDTTNVVRPILSVITPISMDHMDRLGHTLAEIATQKAGIIKPGVPVVSAPQHPEVAEVISQYACAAHAPLYWVSEVPVSSEETSARISPLTWNSEGGEFNLDGPRETWYDLKICLLGKHQLVNAGVAAACCQVLPELSIAVGEADVRDAFATTTWPGRLELLEWQPELLLDGAHNEAGAKVLSEALRDLFHNQTKVLVLGMLAEKQVREVLMHLLPEADVLICTAPANGRTAPLSPTNLAEMAQTITASLGHHEIQILVESDAWAAVKLAKVQAGQDGLVCVCGSLYMVGEVRQAWLEHH